MSQIQIKLLNLGARLRDERLRRDETQKVFAARIGVSVPTLHNMEAGDPGVTIGHWIAALDVLDRTADIDALLAPAREDLFAKYDLMNSPRRRRATARRKL